jgi:hypothetical protein
MIKDNFFDLKRFTHVLRNDFLEHKKTMLQAVVIGYLALTYTIISRIFYLYKSSDVFDVEIADKVSRSVWQFSFIAFAVYILGFTGSSILALSTKQKRITYFMLPATTFEKYLAILLRIVGFYTLSYIVIFYLADWSRMLFYLILYPEAPVIELTDTYFGKNTYQLNFLLPYYLFISIQSAFILGAVSFYVRSFIKTLGVLLWAIAGYMLLNKLFILVCYGKETSWVNVFKTFTEKLEGVLPADNSDKILVAWGVVTLFALVNWIIAYYRLKESQIISKL